jgi:hypothetical protein
MNRPNSTGRNISLKHRAGQPVIATAADHGYLSCNRNRYKERTSFSQDLQECRSILRFGECGGYVSRGPDGLPVHLLNNIAFTNPSVRRKTSGID